MQILTLPEDFDALRQKSQSVKKLDEKLVKFLKELGETLKNQQDPGGAGLSAVQLGKPIRAFAILLPPPRLKGKGQRPKASLTFYLNPEIVEHPNEKTLGEELVKDNQAPGTSLSAGEAEHPEPFLEGCLSVPDTYGSVLRWPWITAKATTFSEGDLQSPHLELRTSNFELEKLAARVFQHELDHLNGILFTDHVLSQRDQLYRQLGEKLEPMKL